MGKIYTEYGMSQTSYKNIGKLNYPNYGSNYTICNTQYYQIANRMPETGIVPQTHNGYSLIPRIGGSNYGYMGHMLLHGNGSTFENADIIHYLGNLSTMEDSADMNNRYAYIGGLYWAKTNIGATDEHLQGYYFQFNTSTGRTASNMYAQQPSYNTPSFTQWEYPINQYGSKWQTSLQGTIESSYRLNGYWRIPSVNDFAFLRSNSNMTYETISGRSGIRFTSKTDDTQSIFLPLAGYVKPTGKASVLNPSSWNIVGYYWTSMGLVEQRGYSYNDYEDKICKKIERSLNNNNINFSTDTLPGWYGLPIRPVMGPEQLTLYGSWMYNNGYSLVYDNPSGSYNEISISELTIRIGQSTKIGSSAPGLNNGYEYADYFVPRRNIYFIAGNPNDSATAPYNWAMLGWLEKGKQYKLDTDGVLYYTSEQTFHYPYNLPVRNGADITFAVVCSLEDSANGDEIMGYLNGGSTTVDAQLSATDWTGIAVFSYNRGLYFDEDESNNNGFYMDYKASSSAAVQSKQMLLNYWVSASMDNDGYIDDSIDLII